MTTDIIFDLDGTLVESSSGILAAFRMAFNDRALLPQQPLTTAVIGPPLMETLVKLAGTDDPAVVGPLVTAFKQNYDNGGYRLTTIFVGVEEMLFELMKNGYRLHIATNKRILPTRRIIEHLGWKTHFLGVYALDVCQPVLASKPELLRYILIERGLEPRDTLYVGDRHEDGEAAQYNRIPFLLATWGFSDQTSGLWEELPTPGELLIRVQGSPSKAS